VSGELDQRVRLAAFQWLRAQMDVIGDVLPRSVLAEGFVLDGERVPLLGPQGIFKPRMMTEAPLSITTIPGRRHLVPPAHLCPVAFDLDEAREFGRGIGSDTLEADDLSVPVMARCLRSRFHDAVPAESEWAERISERHVLAAGEQVHGGPRVSQNECSHGRVHLLDHAFGIRRADPVRAFL